MLAVSTLVDLYQSTAPGEFFKLTRGVMQRTIASEDPYFLSMLFDKAVAEKEEAQNNIFKQYIQDFETQYEANHKCPKYNPAKGINDFQSEFAGYLKRKSFALFEYEQQILQEWYRKNRRVIVSVSLLLRNSEGEFVPRLKREILADSSFYLSDPSFSLSEIDCVSNDELIENYIKWGNRTPVGVYATKALEFLKERVEGIRKSAGLPIDKEITKKEDYEKIQLSSDRDIIFMNAALNLNIQASVILSGHLRKVSEFLNCSLETPRPESASHIQRTYLQLISELGRIWTSHSTQLSRREAISEAGNESPPPIPDVNKEKRGLFINFKALKREEVSSSPRIDLNKESQSQLLQMSKIIFDSLMHFEALLQSVKCMFEVRAAEKQLLLGVVTSCIDEMNQQILIIQSIRKILNVANEEPI